MRVARSPWGHVLLRPRPSGAPRSRLFCFSYAGAGPAVFAKWAAKLPSSIEPVLVQLAGRGARFGEPAYSRLADLADEVAAASRELSDLPWAFYGHSLGALLAFELAGREASGSHSVLRHLFIGAARPPHAPVPGPPLHLLPDPLFVEELQLRYRGIPDEIAHDPELLRLFLPTLRADMTVFETYRYSGGPPLPCPITAFAGGDDPVAGPRLMSEWSEHTAVRFELDVVAGNHFFLPASEDRVLSRIVRALGDTPDLSLNRAALPQPSLAPADDPFRGENSSHDVFD